MTAIPFFEALKELAGKATMPTSLGSAELRLIDAGVRRQSLYSARTTMEGYLEELRGAIESVVNPKQVERTETDEDGNERQVLVTEGLNPATAREELRSKLREMGYKPGEGTQGTILDLSSDARIDLVVKTNVELVQGAGKYIQGTADPDVVEAWPAWELVRYEDRNEPRDWATRWRNAAEVAGDASALAAWPRMVALKKSGIWQALGDGAGGYEDTLGNPFPPFAFNSGMWTEEVSREEATEMGILKAESGNGAGE